MLRVPHIPVLSVAAALVAMMSACSAPAGEAPCSAQSDCASSEICQAGACIPRCISNADCTRDRACQAGVCVEAQRCLRSEECGAGAVCEQGFCRAQSAECSRDSECPPNFTCIEGGCYPPTVPDVGVDAGQDVAPADVVDEPDVVVPEDVVDVTTPDTPRDTAPDLPPADTGRPCVRLADCPAPDLCVDGFCVPPASPECDGAGDRVFGDLCDRSADCCSNLCVGRFDEDYGVCTKPCSSYVECNPGDPFAPEMFCSRTRDGNLCAVSTWMYPCEGAIDCSGGVCLKAASGFPGSGCSWQCTSSADCPAGNVCGTIEVGSGTARACVPIGQSCGNLLGPELGFAECLSGLCYFNDATFSGYCTATCNPADSTACPAPYTCTNPEPTLPSTYVCTLPT